MDDKAKVHALLEQAKPIALQREEFNGQAAISWVRSEAFDFLTHCVDHFLDDREKDSFRALKVRRRQVSYLLGRFAAKSALGNYKGSDFEASKVAILPGVFNQPVVHMQSDEPISVSISHSEELACALAFPEVHPMAIDVEGLDEDRTKVMKTQIEGREMKLAESVCSSENLAATLIWTAKEAVSKVLKCGMTCPYRLLEISSLEVRDDGYSGQFKNFGQYQFQSWVRDNIVVTMVLPRNTVLEFSFPQSI